MASDGVTIESLSPGDGVTFPKRGDNLTMHYDGHLASNNKKFDSSRDRNQPFEFTIGVGQVIRGWDEGVAKLSLGERAKLHIKSHFGYGARGAGGDIPPNADLVFDVQLLAINGVYQRNASGKRACGGCGYYEDEIKSETPVAYKSCANCRQVYYCGKYDESD